MMLSSLALTSSNCKGFKLLTQMGWKEEDGGLGKHRQGTLVPVRPNGNQEQRGLGFAAKHGRRSGKPNVGATLATVVKTTRAQRRRQRQQQADAEAEKMKQARMMLRTDVSDEYQELYRQLHPSG